MPPSAHSPEMVPGAVGHNDPDDHAAFLRGSHQRPPPTSPASRGGGRSISTLVRAQSPIIRQLVPGLVLFHRRNRTRPQCHIADALAEPVSYLSIVPHMRSSDVPLTPQPRSRGAVFSRREPSPASAFCFAKEERRELSTIV